MEVLAIFAVLLFIAIAFRLLAGGMDGNRVEAYIRSQGGELIDSHWSPFGKGWLGEKNDRIYQVQYRDRTGNIREATIKTSMFSGVYVTDDRIVQPAEAEPSQTQNLEMENARLRKRIAELENKDGT